MELFRAHEERQKVQRQEADLRTGLIVAALYNIAALSAKRKAYQRWDGGQFTPGDFFPSLAQLLSPEEEEMEQKIAFMRGMGAPEEKIQGMRNG